MAGLCQFWRTCWGSGAWGVKYSKNGGGLIRAVDSYHFYFSQRFQMWFNVYGADLSTFWCRTVKIGQGDSTGWVKKFENISIFLTFRDFTSIYLRNVAAYGKGLSLPNQTVACVDPSLTGFYRVGHKLSDVIPVLRITPTATASVFLSVVKCGPITTAYTCTHSGIEPSRLTKGFPQGGPKSTKKFEFLTISKINIPISLQPL